MPMMRRMGRPGLLGMAARTAVVAGTATAVSGAVAGHQQAKAVEHQQAAQMQQQEQMEAAAAAAAAAAPAPVPQAAAVPDLVTRLQQLGELRQQGLLNDAEFEQAKAQLLAG